MTEIILGGHIPGDTWATERALLREFDFKILEQQFKERLSNCRWRWRHNVNVVKRRFYLNLFGSGYCHDCAGIWGKIWNKIVDKGVFYCGLKITLICRQSFKKIAFNNFPSYIIFCKIMSLIPFYISFFCWSYLPSPLFTPYKWQIESSATTRIFPSVKSRQNHEIETAHKRVPTCLHAFWAERPTVNYFTLALWRR